MRPETKTVTKSIILGKIEKYNTLLSQMNELTILLLQGQQYYNNTF